ncbi:MAG: DUF87 domain-containing protein [Solirubrobacterales bacterium]
MFVLAISLALLALVSLVVDGALIPHPGSDSLWFYAAALTLMLSDLVLEPWYTRPADAFANAVAVLLASFAAGSAGLQVSKAAFTTGRTCSIVASGAILVAALAAMLTLRPQGGEQGRLHRASFVIASTFGRARVIFSAFFAITAAAAFADSADKMLVLYVLGGLLLWTTPLQTALERLIAVRQPGEQLALAVDEIAQPRTAFLTAAADPPVKVGQPLLRAEKRIGVVVDVSEAEELQQVQASLAESVVLKVRDQLAVGSATGSDLRVVGAIGKQTSLDRLVVRGGGSRFDEVGLREGGLVEADVRGNRILFQVVDAEVEGATPEGSNRSQRVRLMARKLGRWDDEVGEFAHGDWIPSPGSPARMAAVDRTKDIDPALVGRIPDTDYGAEYDPVTGTTHNTAILGILGVGKTTLASELTWRTLAKGARVIVIDITNEYAKLFEPLFGPDKQAGLEDEINESIRARMQATDYEGDHAGNKTLFEKAMRERLDQFFEGDERLLILNPANLLVSQDDGGFADSRNNARRIVSLNPAEVTAIIAREVLRQVSGEITEDLKVCLVLEEAHSLAPEWNSTANDGEKQAATATARALMQGRKFGFGSIVVTQRTATVTKSILNQCNTVFALRVYDQTGTEFLGNFIGTDYARLLANLPDRHAVVFGKASSCHSPLLVELNDSTKLEEWRKSITEDVSTDQSDGEEP